MTRIVDARPPREATAQLHWRRPGLGKSVRPQLPQLSKGRLWRAAGLTAVATLFVLMLLDWEVGAIRIRGSSAADLERIQIALRPYLGAPLLLVDGDAMAATLRQDPWVRRVRVKRLPPQTIVLAVQEAEPQFRLADGGAVDTRGRRLPPRAGVDLSALPLLVCERYGERERMGLKALQESLSAVPWCLGSGLQRVVFDARGVTLHSNDGFQIVLGHGDFASRLLRLAQAQQRLSPVAGDRLDLRFTDQIVLAHVGNGVRGG